MHLNTAKSFRRQFDQKTTIPHDSRYNTLPVSIAVRMRTAENDALDRGVVNKYLAGSFNGYQLFVQNGLIKGWYYRYQLTHVSVVGPRIDDNQWHDVVFVANSTGGYIYVDRELVATNSWVGTPTVCVTTAPLTFGLYPFSSFERFTNVDLEYVQLWGVSLSHERIVSGPDMTYIVEDTLNLIGYWQLNEQGSEMSVFDSSIYRNHGVYSASIPSTLVLRSNTVVFNAITRTAAITRYHLPVEDRIHIDTSTLVYIVLSFPSVFGIQRFDADTSQWTSVTTTFTQADVLLGHIRLQSGHGCVRLSVTNPDSQSLEFTLISSCDVDPSFSNSCAQALLSSSSEGTIIPHTNMYFQDERASLPQFVHLNSAKSFRQHFNQTVTIPHDSRYNTLPLSIAVRMRTPETAADKAVVNKYRSGSHNGYQLYLSDGVIMAWYYVTGTNYARLMSGPRIDDNEWHDVVFVVNSTAAYLYVDRQLVSTNTWTIASSVCSTTEPLVFAFYPRDFSRPDVSVDRYSNVDLEYVQLWNVSLSHDRIINGHDMAYIAEDPLNLIGYWQLNEQENETSVFDSSIYRNHGVYSTSIPSTLEIRSDTVVFNTITRSAAITRYHLPVEDQIHINSSTLVFGVLSIPSVYDIQRFDVETAEWTSATTTFTQTDIILGYIRLTSMSTQCMQGCIRLAVTNPACQSLEFTFVSLYGNSTTFPSDEGCEKTLPSPISGSTTTVYLQDAALSVHYNTAKSFQKQFNQTAIMSHNSRYNTLPISIAVRMRTTENTPQEKAVVNKYRANSSNGYQLYVRNGILMAWYYVNGANYVKMSTGLRVDDNQWRDIVFVVNSTAAYLYVDRQLVSMNIWTGTPSACNTVEPITFALYPRQLSQPSKVDLYSDIELEYVQLWNVSLSHDRIVSGADMAYVAVDSPTLIGYWQLNEQENETSVFDSSIYRNHGAYSASIPSTIELRSDTIVFDTTTRTAAITRYHLPVEDRVHINSSTLVYTVQSIPSAYSLQRYDAETAEWTNMTTIFTQTDVILGYIRLKSVSEQCKQGCIRLTVTNPDCQSFEFTLISLYAVNSNTISYSASDTCEMSFQSSPSESLTTPNTIVYLQDNKASIPLFVIGEQVVATFGQPIQQGQFRYRAWDSISSSYFDCAIETVCSLVCTLTRNKSALEYQKFNLGFHISVNQSTPLWTSISVQPVQHYSLGTAPSLTTASKIHATDASSIVTLNASLPSPVRNLVNCSIDGILVATTQLSDSSYECDSIIAQPGLRNVTLMFIEPDTKTNLTISERVSLAFVDITGSIESSFYMQLVPGSYLIINVTGIRLSSFKKESFVCKYGPSSLPMQYISSVTSIDNLTPHAVSAGASKVQVTCNIVTTQSARFLVSVWMRPFVTDEDDEARIASNFHTMDILDLTALSWAPSQVKAAYTTDSPVLATITLQNSLHQDIASSNTTYCRHLDVRTQATSDVLIQWESATSIKCEISSLITTKVMTSLWYIHNGIELQLSTSDIHFAFIRPSSAADQTGDTAYPFPSATVMTNGVLPVPVPIKFNIGFDASALVAAPPAVKDDYICLLHDAGNTNAELEIDVSNFTSDGSRTNLTCIFPGDYLQPSQSHAVNITLWIKINGEQLLISDWIFRFYFIQRSAPSWFDNASDKASISTSAVVSVKLPFADSEEILEQAVCAQNPVNSSNARQAIPTSIVDLGLRRYNCTLSRPSPIGTVELSLLFPVRNSAEATEGPTIEYLEITTTRLEFTFLPNITLQSLSPSLGLTISNLTTILHTTMPKTVTNIPSDIAFHCRWNSTWIDDSMGEESCSAVWNVESGTFECTISAAYSRRVALSVTATVHGTTVVLSENSTLIATLVQPTAAVYSVGNRVAATLNSTFDVNIRLPFTMDVNMIAKTSCKQSGVEVDLQRPTTGDGIYICSLSRSIKSSQGDSYVHPITLWYTDDYGETLEITGSH